MTMYVLVLFRSLTIYNVPTVPILYYYDIFKYLYYIIVQMIIVARIGKIITLFQVY